MTILALTVFWKWFWIVAVLVVGIGAAVIRSGLDALDNFETGYGAGTRQVERQCIAILVLAAFGTIAIFLFGGCALVDGIRQFDELGNS